MNRLRAGYLEGMVSTFANLLLFGLKYWAGIISGSVALVADAWHTLSDSASSIIVLIGTKLSSKKADRQHPFGHGRWEHIAALMIGLILVIIAYSFIKESILQYRAGDSAQYGLVAIIVTVASILVKEGLARYAFYLSRRSKNISVKADGRHHRVDAISSAVILVGIMLRKYVWWIDSLLGIMVSIMLIYTAYEIISGSINKLLGEKPSDELVKKIKEIVTHVAGDNLHPHHFHIHNYVTHKEMTFHLIMDGKLTIGESHDIVTLIEDEIREKLEIESTIHVEPVDHQ